jgi:transposase
MSRRPYPSDVRDEEWEFVAPYLSLLPQTAAQRRHDLREVFNAVRYFARTGAPWRWLPTNFPPWEAVYQQTRRWIAAGCFEALVQDLRLLVRAAAGRRPQPSAALVDSRTLRSTGRADRAPAWTGRSASVAPRSMRWSIPWARSWRWP